MFGFFYDLEAQRRERVEYTTLRRIDGKLCQLDTDFRHEYIQYLVFVLKGVLAECVNMKANGRCDIGKGLLFGITFCDDNAFYSQWIGNIAVQVLLNNYLDPSLNTQRDVFLILRISH